MRPCTSRTLVRQALIVACALVPAGCALEATGPSPIDDEAGSVRHADELAQGGGIRDYTYLECDASTSVVGERLDYRVGPFAGASSALELTAGIPLRVRERNRLLGGPTAPVQTVTLFEDGRGRWTLPGQYSVLLSDEGERSVEIHDHTIGQVLSPESVHCTFRCDGPTVRDGERCIWTGETYPDEFGDLLIQTVVTAGFGVLYRVARWGTAAALRAALGEAIGASARNTCVFCVLSRITGLSFDDISARTGWPIGRVPERVFNEMLEELGLRATQTTYSTWDEALAAVVPGDDYIVRIRFPDELVPAGAPPGHAVLLERGTNFVDPSRGVEGLDVISRVVNGERFLMPIQSVTFWRLR